MSDNKRIDRTGRINSEHYVDWSDQHTNEYDKTYCRVCSEETEDAGICAVCVEEAMKNIEAMQEYIDNEQEKYIKWYHGLK